MMAIEYDDEIIVIDSGFLFPGWKTTQVLNHITPDITYLEENKHKIRAQVFTHGRGSLVRIVTLPIKFLRPYTAASLHWAWCSAPWKKLLRLYAKLQRTDPEAHDGMRGGR